MIRILTKRVNAWYLVFGFKDFELLINLPYAFLVLFLAELGILMSLYNLNRTCVKILFCHIGELHVVAIVYIGLLKRFQDHLFWDFWNSALGCIWKLFSFKHLNLRIWTVLALFGYFYQTILRLLKTFWVLSLTNCWRWDQSRDRLRVLDFTHCVKVYFWFFDHFWLWYWFGYFERL